MKFLFPLVILCIAITEYTYAQEMHPKTSLEFVQDALLEGRISIDDAMDLKIKVLKGETLPEEFRSPTPIKCGFGIVAEVHEYLKTHPEKKVGLQKKAMQSVYDHSFTAKGGTRIFRINYDVSGPDAVPSLDANSNSIPDWVEETGLAFERSYLLEVDTLGYREPLSFSAFGHYDIYIVDLSNSYGYTQDVSQVTSNPDTYTSEIYVENDYSEGFYTHGYDALRVTCGHEFFHAIQFSYNFRESDAWYYEVSSTWMEDVTYDNVNDYYAYLPSFFGAPETSLDSFSGLWPYGAAVWNHMIEKKYGRDAIKKSWEYMPSRNAITSIDGAIKSISSSNLSKTFSEFAVWDYYTAGRADSIAYFPEALHYPKIKLLSNRAILDTMIQRTLPTLAANYYNFYVASDTAYCEIKFQAAESNSYFDVYTVEYNKATGKNIVVNHGGSSDFAINNLLHGDTLLFLVVNKVTDYTINGNYSYTLRLTLKQQVIDTTYHFHFYPSPFVIKSGNEKMNFVFSLGKTTKMEFMIYTVSGKLIRKINFGELSPGNYDGTSGLFWDGKDSHGHFVPGGVYIYQFTGKGFKKTGKIAVVR